MSKKNLIVFVLILVLTGCGIHFSDSTTSKGNVKIDKTDWTDFKRSEIKLGRGERVLFCYDSEVEEGALIMTLFNPNDQVVASLPTGIKSETSVEIQEEGLYYLLIVGNNFTGNTSVEWSVN